MIIDLIGKHGRIRTVPMPSWAKAALDEWREAAGFSGGRLLRAINKGGSISHDSMRAQSVFETVAGYGERIGVKITPHDLRRTFAKLAHQGQAALEQIRTSANQAHFAPADSSLVFRIERGSRESVKVCFGSNSSPGLRPAAEELSFLSWRVRLRMYFGSTCKVTACGETPG